MFGGEMQIFTYFKKCKYCPKDDFFDLDLTSKYWTYFSYKHIETDYK